MKIDEIIDALTVTQYVLSRMANDDPQLGKVLDARNSIMDAIIGHVNFLEEAIKNEGSNQSN